MGEIFPKRLRDYGMAMCAMMIWLMNYIVSKIAPIATPNIGWKTWTIFGKLNIAAMIFSWFLPETSNLSIEEMDVLFGVVDDSVRQQDVEKNIGRRRLLLVIRHLSCTVCMNEASNSPSNFACRPQETKLVRQFAKP